MAAQWLNQTGDATSRLAAVLSPLFRRLSQPSALRRVRRVLMLVILLWIVSALVSIVWNLLPQSANEVGPPPAAINPVSSVEPAGTARQIDIERLRGWHLFGEAGAAPVLVQEQAEPSAREGIENDARPTRLALKLRGIVASTDDGLGHAIIEHRARQAVYAVEDKLPVGDRVTLAKVMPTQVILNNRGTYERLELFDKSSLGATSQPLRPPAAAPAETSLDKRGDLEATALAADYRSRLYKNPQSLAEVVSVSAVREGGALRGYRVAPGKDRTQFEQLGFKPGDVVTSINGVPLDNPANTMKLYNMMRSASEVSFELERNSQPMSLSVSLGSAGG